MPRTLKDTLLCTWPFQYQHLPIAKWLLEQGALPSCTDWDGRTPLHDGLETDHSADYVSLLLTYGANQNVIDGFGDTPLELAIKLRETTSEEILRKHATQD